VNDRHTRFSDLVEAYAKYRYRNYPSKVLDAIFGGLGDPHNLAIADIGAGTGASARLLAERGAHVIAVEPNARMRERAFKHSSIEWRDGTAEATGLGDASVDVVAMFQAFHWFDAEAAIAEFRRIARRRVVTVQYEHEESDEASRGFGALLRAYSTDDTDLRRRHALERFTILAGPQLHSLILNADWELTLEELHGYVESISYVPHRGERAKELRRETDALFERCCEGDRIVTLPLRVYVLSFDL
jgi:ubiquinone/menaquinone biosynthesis C-methylase UbiE